MKTARDRLEFAIRFAEADLAALRPGDWMNLREELEAFNGYGPRVADGLTLGDLGGVLAMPLAPPLPQDLSEDDFRKLQADVRGLFGGQGHEPMKGAGVVTGTVSETIPIELRLGVLPLRGLGAALLSVTGKARDVTIYRLASIIAQNADKIRRCPDPNCQRLFYRVRRQLYCSKTCVARANKRAEREAERNAPGPKPAARTPIARSRDNRPKKPARGKRKKGAR